jgi:hypothetical protein
MIAIYFKFLSYIGRLEVFIYNIILCIKNNINLLLCWLLSLITGSVQVGGMASRFYTHR